MNVRWLAGTAALVAPMVVLGCGADETTPGVNLPQDMSADGFYTPTPLECPDGEPQLVNGRPATWTVIHYAAGDNDLEDNILTDINEMELGMNNGSPNVRVVVQLDRKTENGVWRYEIRPDSVANDPERNQIVSRLVGYSQDEPDSGDYRTLIEFGRWAAFCYPADNYIVIIGGHGRGWSVSSSDDSDPIATDPDGTVAFDEEREERTVYAGDGTRFIAPDDSNGSEIYIDQLVTALNAIREVTRRPDDWEGLNRLVLYGSDACLMGTIEVAYDMRNAVRYLIGSEQKEPDHGWPYSTILRSLNDRPTHYSGNPDELVIEFVDAYRRSYGPNGAAGEVSTSFTLAGVDTEQTISARQRIDSMVDAFLRIMGDPYSNREELFSHIDAARAATPTFGGTYIDLGSFLVDLRERLIAAGMMPEQGQWWDGDERYLDLRIAIDDLMDHVWVDLVIALAAGSDYDQLLGLSVYFPEQACNVRLPLDKYSPGGFAQATRWDELVEHVLYRDIREAHGMGNIHFRIDDLSIVDAVVECHIGNNDLFVVVHPQNAPVTYQDAEVSVPALSMAMTPTEGGGLMLTSAQIDARDSLGFRTEERNLSIDVEEVDATLGVIYTGQVTIPFEISGEAHPVSVGFFCAAFQLACR